MYSKTITIALAVALTASSADAQLWTSRTGMPGQGRHHPVTFSLDGYGYVATGSTNSSSATRDFFRYDPTDDSWEILPDFPGAARGYAYGGAYDGKGYLGFGYGPGYLADLWEYDPDTQTWTQLASLPGRARTHPAFVITDDGMIYVSCGGSAVGNLRDLWEYDIATDAWVQRADLPGPNRHHPYYWNAGDVPYVAFGHGGGIYRDVYRFDPIAHTWSQMANHPGEQRVAGTQFSYDGYGYVLSGEGVDHVQFETGEFWRYDHVNDTWLELTPHPGSGRWAPGTFLIGDELYFLGGLSTSALETSMWSYTMGPIIGVDAPQVAPTALAMAPAQPNPFRAGTTLSFELPVSDEVAISIVDAGGRLVRTFGARVWPAGAHRVAWDGRSDRGEVTPPGVYFARVATPTGNASARLVRVP